MYIDNLFLLFKDFETQPKFMPKQWQWADVFVRFEVGLIHKPEHDNVVPDALTPKCLQGL